MSGVSQAEERFLFSNTPDTDYPVLVCCCWTQSAATKTAVTAYFEYNTRFRRLLRVRLKIEAAAGGDLGLLYVGCAVYLPALPALPALFALPAWRNPERLACLARHVRLARTPKSTYTGRLALQLVADFLEHWQLHQTLSILKLETDLAAGDLLPREKLESMMRSNDAVAAAASFAGNGETKTSGDKSPPVLHKVCGGL